MRTSLCRALAQSTRRTRSRSLQFLLRSSYSISTSSSNSFATDAKQSTISHRKSPPLPSFSDCPRPREIPFQAKVANSVNLVGYIGQPIQFQISPDSKNWAATVITQKPSSDSPPLWYFDTFSTLLFTSCSIFFAPFFLSLSFIFAGCVQFLFLSMWRLLFALVYIPWMHMIIDRFNVLYMSCSCIRL